MTDYAKIGDVGITFRVTIEESDAAVDVSAATAVKIFFKKPDGSIIENIAEFNTDGTDGKIKYKTTAAVEIDQRGTWNYYGQVTFSATEIYTNPLMLDFEVIA